MGKIAEEHRTAIRQIRRDANERLKKMEKDKEISEDDEYRLIDEVQKVTDQCVGQIDELAKAKETEIIEG